MSVDFPKYYINSHTHRVKLRLIQVLILSVKFSNKVCVSFLLRNYVRISMGCWSVCYSHTIMVLTFSCFHFCLSNSHSILVFHSMFQTTCKMVAEHLVGALQHDNQRSVRYLMEWTVALIFTRFPDLISSILLPCLKAVSFGQDN